MSDGQRPTHAAARRRARGDGGAALVEFAIIAPLLFGLLLGLFSGGIALAQKNSMSSAVREAARFGATLDHGASWDDSVIDRVLDLAPEDLASNQVCARLIERGSPDTVVETSSCAATILDDIPDISSVPSGECAVVVWAQRQDELNAVFISRDLTLNAGSVSSYERDCD